MTLGLASHFAFFNGERPHQSPGQQTPEVVYEPLPGAIILDKFAAEAKSKTTATAKSKAKLGH